MGQYKEFCDGFNDVEGWFSLDSAALWDALLEYQASLKLGGHIFEIGVFKGKSAAMLALHMAKDENLLLVDPWTLDDVVRNRLLAVKPDNLLFCPMPSTAVWSSQVIQTGRFSFRWIHVDGEHSGVAVDNDLRLANELLHDKGVLVVDDFFNPAYPQITWSTIRFLDKHRYELAPFLCGFNKLYICRPAALKDYLSFVKDHILEQMTERGREAILYKTTYPSDLNCFGIGPHYDKSLPQLWGPDWARDDVMI